MSEVEGFGTLLQFGNASGQTSTSWTNIAKIKDLEPPEPEAGAIKTTHMQSLNHAHTYQAGLIEGGDAKVTAIFDKTGYNTLNALLRIQKDFRVVFNDGAGVPTNSSNLEFDGFLKKIGPKTPMDDVDTYDATFKVSGLPTFTPAP